MHSGFERIVLAGLSAAFAICAGSAHADGRAIDASYGRVDGDVGVVLGVGGAIAPRGARAEAELRLRYLETAGIYAALEDAGMFASSSEPRRVFVTGLELRPLFLLRWLRGYERQHARFDLAVDSIGFGLGMMFEQPTGADFAAREGFELSVGLELPILDGAEGPWIGLRGALRWSDAALGSGIHDVDDRQAVFVVTFAWHLTLAAHLVDVGDRAPR